MSQKKPFGKNLAFRPTFGMGTGLLLALLVGFLGLLFRIVDSGMFIPYEHLGSTVFYRVLNDTILVNRDEFLSVVFSGSPWLSIPFNAFFYSVAEYPFMAFLLTHIAYVGIYALSFVLFRYSGVRLPLAATGALALPLIFQAPLGLSGPLIYSSRIMFLLGGFMLLHFLHRRWYLAATIAKTLPTSFPFPPSKT